MHQIYLFIFRHMIQLRLAHAHLRVRMRKIDSSRIATINVVDSYVVYPRISAVTR